MKAADAKTAAAFASSWNTVRQGSVYTAEQFLDWFDPLTPSDIRGKEVLELGFGNGSLLYHVALCQPRRLVGVELGDTHETARTVIPRDFEGQLELVKDDLTTASVGAFDVVYCIGVLHHLRDPEAGFRAVVRHTRPGGRFHCWVYAREGNAIVIRLVEPIRKVASRLPWWLTKYAVALPLAVPFYLYAKLVAWVVGGSSRLRTDIPLADYCVWIAKREFWFFHHVAFDQLVTPSTQYVPRCTVDAWLESDDIDPESTYVVFRNGNSWKFGGRRRDA